MCNSFFCLKLFFKFWLKFEYKKLTNCFVYVFQPLKLSVKFIVGDFSNKYYLYLEIQKILGDI
jgi:hypothetical protein